jgi:hypothetical protein
MAKTNFSKMEMLLHEGLLQVQVKNLLELADVAAGKGDIAKENPVRVLQARKAIARLLQHELNYMYKSNSGIYNTIGIDREKLFKIFDAPDKISDEDWDYLSKIKTKVDIFRKGKQAMVNPKANEDLIEQQRKHHVNKRFNVNDKWLPLR